MKQFFLVGAMGLLAGCDAEVTTKQDTSEKVASSSAADGQVRFDLPFAKGNIKLPAGMMSSADFDIDGVKMYPGATVTGFNVDAENGRALVDIAFAAPAAPDAVRDYFLEQFKAKGVDARADGQGISGTSKDGDRFTMTFAPDGGGSNGDIRIDAQDKRRG